MCSSYPEAVADNHMECGTWFVFEMEPQNMLGLWLDLQERKRWEQWTVVIASDGAIVSP